MEATDRILKSAGIDETGSSWPIPVTGRKRRSLKTRWGDGVLSQPLLEGPGRKAPRNGTEPKKKNPRRSRRRCIAIGPERSETARRHGGGSLRSDQDRPGREPVHAAGIFGVCVGMEAHLRRAQLVEALESPE